MPNLRAPTPDELHILQQNGVDVSKLPDKLLFDDPEPTISTPGAIGHTLETHAGRTVLGGLGSLGGSALVAGLGLDASGVGAPLGIPLTILGALAGSLGGGSIGQKLQEKIQGPDITQRLTQEQAAAEQQHPIATQLTDIIGSALASGGSFKPSNILNAIGGDKEALAHVALNAVVNPAINSGVDYLMTGQKPTIGNLALQAAGGAVMSGQSALGRAFSNVHGEPVEPTTKTDPIQEGQSLATNPDTQPKGPLSPYTMKENDNFSIDDNNIKKLYMTDFAKKINKVGKDATPEDIAAMNIANAQARSENNRMKGMPIDQMRQALHEAWLKKQEEMLNAQKTAQPKEEPNNTYKTDYQNPFYGGRKFYGNERGEMSQNPDDVSARTPDNLGIDPEKLAQPIVDAYQEQNAEQSRLNEQNATAQAFKISQQRQADFEKAQQERLRQNDEEVLNKPVSENTLRITKDNFLQNDLNRPQTPLSEGVAKENEVDANKYAPPSDYTRFNEVQQQMKSLMQKGDFASDEFRKLWKETEDIKNKNEGMPPKQEINTYTDAKNVSELRDFLINKKSEYAPLLSDLKIDREGLEAKVGKTGMRSLYDPTHDAIGLGPYASDYEATHEIIHAATSKKIEALPKDHPIIKELNDCLNESRKVLYRDKPDTEFYGLKDLHEFTAEALSNKEFQQQLNNIKTNKGTIWSRLVDAIRKLLGVDVKHGSMLERVLKPIDELTQMERPKSSENAPKGENKFATTYRDELTPALKVDNNIHKGKLDENGYYETHGEIYNRLQRIYGEELYKKPYYSGFVDKNGTFYTREQAKQKYGVDDTAQLWARQRQHDTNPPKELDYILGDNNKYAPPPKGSKPTPKDEEGNFVYNKFRSMVDSIRAIKHPLAQKLGDAFYKTLEQKQLYIGQQLNPILEKARGLTPTQDARLQKAIRYERETGQDAMKTGILRTQQERQLFQQAKDSLRKNFEERFKNQEPVYRNGQATLPKRDEFYWPTTTDPKVAQTYRENSDTAKIAQLDKTFLDYQNKLGITPSDAQSNLKTWKAAVQGTLDTGKSEMTYFNAARKAQGIPLPPEFTRPGFVKNLEAYFHRQAADNSFYKHVESNPYALAALGETKDAWGKDVNVQNPQGSLAHNSEVQAQLRAIRGEAVGGEGYHNEKALSSLATTMFIGPGTTIHKLGSNEIGMISLADNPYQLSKMLTASVANFKKGLEHATENGVVKMTARSLHDVFNSNLTFAERLQAVAKTVRDVYSLGDLTDKLSSGMLQAGIEGILPEKIGRANRGDVTNQTLLKRVDPDYVVGKTYTPEEISKLASGLVNRIHGTGDGRTMPSWMSGDSELSGFFKLSNWGIAQTNKFFQDVYTPATKGNITPLINGLFGAAVGGYTIKELREKLQGKKGQIPSLQEIAASSKGIEGNIPLVGYNLMAALSYAGFGGMLSTLSKVPVDFMYKNSAQGAAFPMDEVASDLGKTIGDITTAIANDPHVDWMKLVQQLGTHVVTTNFQLGRTLYNQAVNAGLITGTPAEKKMLADKMGELRRFKMVEGLPYAEQDANGNQFTNLEQKAFKFEQNPQKIAEQLPQLISHIMEAYHSNPDVMMQKLKALKENQYATFPSLEDTPLSFMKYLSYLSKKESPQAAQEALMDFMKRKTINEIKASVVP